MAAQVLATMRVLAQINWAKLANGQSADDVHPQAVADCDLAFLMLTDRTATQALKLS
jgi:hypothetical protein